MERVVEIKGLVFEYRRRFTLSIEWLYLRSGLTLLVGPNGSGKTTLIHLLTGVLKPLRGVVRVLGLDPIRDSREVLRRVSFCLENTQFPPHTVLRDVVEYLGDEGYRLAEELGLDGYLGHSYSMLSSGNRRKFILLSCLAKPADLYLIDEPFSSLDYPSKLLVGELLNREGREKTIVVSTHEAANLRPRDVVFLVDGRVVRCIRDYRPGLTVEVEGPDGLLSLDSVEALNSILRDGYRVSRIVSHSLFEELYGGGSGGCV